MILARLFFSEFLPTLVRRFVQATPIYAAKRRSGIFSSRVSQ